MLTCFGGHAQVGAPGFRRRCSCCPCPAQDKKLGDLPAYKALLTTFNSSEIIRWPVFLSQYKEELAAETEAFSGASRSVVVSGASRSVVVTQCGRHAVWTSRSVVVSGASRSVVVSGALRSVVSGASGLLGRAMLWSRVSTLPCAHGAPPPVLGSRDGSPTHSSSIMLMPTSGLHDAQVCMCQCVCVCIVCVCVRATCTCVLCVFYRGWVMHPLAQTNAHMIRTICVLNVNASAFRGHF